MGLYVHSLAEVPAGAKRGYYLYLLDYGWDEPLANVMWANLPQMADSASRSNAAVIHGPRGLHFEDEVLSWHHVNGQDAKDLLPAILITTRHPATFRESGESYPTKRSRKEAKDALLLLPLRKICKTPDDVVRLIQRIFEDMKSKKRLFEFEATKHMKRGIGGALVDAVILKPSFGGIGFDLKEFFRRE